jgi:hypothetical protein
VSVFISFDQCKFEVYFSEVSIATPACFGGAIGLVNLPAFHPKPVLVSVSEMGSWKQQIVGSLFLIWFAKWCLLMES